VLNTKCSLQAQVLNTWSPLGGTIMEGSGNSKRLEEVSHSGCAFEGYTWSLVPLSLSACCPPWVEQSLLLHYHVAVMLCLIIDPESTELNDYGWKSLKPWAIIYLSFFKLCSQVFVLSYAKLTDIRGILSYPHPRFSKPVLVASYIINQFCTLLG
jgi:hypothetical protein